MQAYTGFAQVYDIFMDNIPYDDWTDYLTGLLREYGVKEGLVLELGCGTGNITRRLAAGGYDMIGIDNSEEMLEIAREKEYSDDSADVYGSPILYLRQDMRSFELYGTVGAVVSICDSMNYVTSEQDLLRVFQLVNNYLDPGGIFIFDMNTEYKYKNILADNIIAENREQCSFIWENNYDEKKQINEYNVTVFVKLEDDAGVTEAEEDELEENKPEEEGPEENASEEYELECDNRIQLFGRFQETHYQKAYSIDRVKKLIEEAGMELLRVYDAFTHNFPTDKSERVYFAVREKYQENKKYI